MFESIFTATTDGAISISSSVTGIGIGIILGLVIGFAYTFLCRKDGYGKNFILGLIILPAIVAAVILLVGSNVARAFSMAGAFALVRFRSAPGNAKDIAVVFFAMASGLACGLGYVTFACVFTAAILVLLFVLELGHFAEGGRRKKQLRITIPENLNYESVFDDILDKNTENSELKKVKTTNMGTMFELTYSIIMKKGASEKELIDAIRTRNGNLNITLGLESEDSGLLN